MQLIESSPNGLVIYSDVHTCKDGVLEVNNLQIDKNYHIRSFEFLKLPEYRKKIKSMIPVPGLKKSVDDMDLIKIMEIDRNQEINLVIEDHFLNVMIRIGRFDHTVEPQKTLNSELGGITLYIFENGGELTQTLEAWYQYLIDTLEILPPTKLGMLLETLWYFMDNQNTEPSAFDKSIVRTILASHEIFFEINDITNVMNIYQKYSESFSEADFDIIDQFLSSLQDNPRMPIQFFTDKSDKDLVYLIYLFLILEKEDVIKIDRPGIVEST